MNSQSKRAHTKITFGRLDHKFFSFSVQQNGIGMNTRGRDQARVSKCEQGQNSMMIFVKNASINEKWRSALLSRIYVQKCVSLSRLFIKCSVSRLFINCYHYCLLMYYSSRCLIGKSFSTLKRVEVRLISVFLQRYV